MNRYFRPLFSSLCATTLIFVAGALHAQDFPEPGVFPPAGDGWQNLYDGTNFSEWEENEIGGWKEEPGGILSHQGSDGGRSHLFYMGPNNNWRDFEFVVEVRTSPTTNSGIMFHSHWFNTGWDPFGNEAQINNTTPNERMRTGSLYGSIEVHDSYVNDNEWWTHYIRVEGQRVVIRVDDKTEVDWISNTSTTYRDLSQGTFVLQGHDHIPERKIEFRNIYARRLTPIDSGLWVDAGDHKATLANIVESLSPTIHQDGVPATSFTSTWEVIAQPDGSTVTFGDVSVPDTTASFSQDGNYTLKITAQSGTETYIDSVKYRVGNQVPVITGESYREVDPATDVVIDDLEATDDGLPNAALAYQWQVTNAPGAYSISDTTVLSPTFQFTDPGDYHFNLTASDGLATSLAHFIFVVRPLGELPEGCRGTGTEVGIYRLDNHYLDATGSGVALQPHGNATFDATNLSWMTSQLGSAVRVQGQGDQLTVAIPDSLIDEQSPGDYSVSARLYINQFLETPGPNLNVLSFSQRWDSGVSFVQSGWESVPRFRFGNTDLMNEGEVAAALSTGTWNHVVINVRATGTVELYVNDILIGTHTVSVNPQFSEDFVLTVGNFDGWIDDLCISNSVEPINEAPTVGAGDDKVIVSNVATLEATSTDDGLPGSGLTYSWITLTEPSSGAAVITTSGSLSTAVTLSQLGLYTFQISASDGALTSMDTVSVSYLDSASDADADGWPNIVEAYLGTDLSLSDDPIQALVTDSSGSTMIRYERAATPPTGVTGHFEWSADLSSWQLSGETDASGRSVTISEQVVSGSGADPEVVEATFTVSDEARIFARLRAQQ